MPNTAANCARILIASSGACPELSLPQANDPAEDIAAARDAIVGHLMFDGRVEVTAEVVESSAAMTERLSWLYEPLAEISTRLLYFSGHAVLTRSQEVALAFPDSASAKPSTLLSASLLNQYLANCPRSRHVWLMDCCFAHGLAFKRLPEVVQGMLNHLVIASSSSYSRSIGSPGVSPFTEALSLGIRGLAYAPDEAILDVSGLMEFLEAETQRRRLPSPYFHYSGSAGATRFCSSQPKELAGDIDLVLTSTIKRRGRPELILGVGENSERTTAFAVRSGGIRPSRTWNLDGRTAAMFGMSKTETGFSQQKIVPIAIEDIRSDEAWREALELRSQRLIVATAATDDIVPDFAADSVGIVNTPPPTEQEAQSLLSSLNLDRQSSDLSAEDLLQVADGSMLALQRLARASALSQRSNQAVEPQQLTIARTLQLLGTEAPASLVALAVLATAPDIRIPVDPLVWWLAVQQNVGETATRIPALLLSSGLVFGSEKWLRVPEAFIGDIAGYLPDCDISFVEFVESAIRAGNAPAIAPMERFQILRAATYYCERTIGEPGREEYVERLFTAIGSELFATVRRNLWMPIVEQIEQSLGETGSSALLTVIGNAHRLADSYRKAEHSFTRAIDIAHRPQDRLLARAGLIRLAVQAGGSVDMPGDAEAADTEIDDQQKAKTDQAVADLLNQNGNRAFRADETETARDCYLRAKALVRIVDITSAVLAVDIEKGLGDIALLTDQPDAAERHVTLAFRLIADYGMMRLGRVPVAKLLQYAGDTARRRAVTGPDPESIDRRSSEAAAYWYSRAYREYENQGLDLGALITTFKLAELDALEGRISRAFNSHVELCQIFTGLSNHLWAYRSMVAAVKARGRADTGFGDLIVQKYRNEIRAALASDGLSSFDRLWGTIAVLATEDDAAQNWSQASNLARALGISRIEQELSRQSLGSWLFAYY